MKKLAFALTALCLSSVALADKIINNSDENDMAVTYMICEGSSSPWGSDTTCHSTQEVTINSAKKGINCLDIALPQANKTGNYVWLFVTKALAQQSGNTVAESSFTDFRCGASDVLILNDMHSPYVICQDAHEKK